MWEDDYIGSLNLLPNTLAELGAAVGLERVSLEEEERGKLDLSRAEDLVRMTLSTLDSLEEEHCFFFLSSLSKLERELKSILAQSQQWKLPEVADEVEQVLMPVLHVVSRFAPEKAFWICLNMKDFLERIGGYEWDGEDCLEHLSMLHENLEELQPGRWLACGKELHRLLVVHSCCLARLACHPFFKRERGRRNLFHKLISVKRDLEAALNYGDLLVEMQEVFEELNCLQAIDLQE